MQRIVVIEGELGEKNLERLQKQFPQFTFQMFPTGHAEEAAVRQAEVVVVNANRKLVKPAESAKYIHTLSAGVDGILDDLEQYHPQALFTNAAGVYDDCVGEHMLMLMLVASRDLRHDIERMADGCWDKQPVKAEIAGSNVLVLGTGSIGTRVAEICRVMKAQTIVGYKAHKSECKAPFDRLIFDKEELKKAMAEVDFVSICLPGSSYTKGLFDAELFACLKRGAIVANVGRGNIVDHDALVQALKDGTVGYYATDVTDPEPLPQDHPLWAMKHVIITPHSAGTIVNPMRQTDWFAENLQAYVDGKNLPGLVDRKLRY